MASLSSLCYRYQNGGILIGKLINGSADGIVASILNHQKRKSEQQKTIDELEEQNVALINRVNELLEQHHKKKNEPTVDELLTMVHKAKELQ